MSAEPPEGSNLAVVILPNTIPPDKVMGKWILVVVHQPPKEEGNGSIKHIE